jgi:hypothetical protein
LPATNVATPSLAVAATNGMAAVAWYEQDDDGTSVVHWAISRDHGTTFSTPVPAGRVGTIAGFAKPFVAIVSTARGPSAWLAFPAERDGELGLAWLHSADGVTAERIFLAPPPLPEGSEVGAIAADATGGLHTLWLAGTRVYYVRRDADRWRAPVLIDSSATQCRVATLAQRGASEVVAFWHRDLAGGEQDFAYARSTDDGAAFAAVARVSNDAWGFTSCPRASPTLSVEGNGAIRFTFEMPGADATTATRFLVDRSADGVIFKPRTFLDVDGFADARFAQIAVDRDGGLALALDGIRNNRRYVIVRHSLGAPDGSRTLDADWMRPAAPIVLDRSGAGEAPVLAATDDGILTVWISREHGTGRVLARRLSIDQLCGLAPVPDQQRLD